MKQALRDGFSVPMAPFSDIDVTRLFGKASHSARCRRVAGELLHRGRGGRISHHATLA